jgi:iron complex transport system permease protein
MIRAAFGCRARSPAPALLLAADIAVRIIPSTSDIKVGVLTSIIGVPFFLYLIMRERRALGGGVA